MQSEHLFVVLLVDDQDIIAEAVRRMLADQEDIRFYHCSDPAKAIETANQVKPTVILQDLVMPDIDGLLLVRFYRANTGTANVPLIVLSAKEEAATKAEAFALGANDYMVKLPDRLEVIARIRYHSKGYINLLLRKEAQAQLEKANHFIRKTFGRYLSDEVVNSILESPDGLTLGGEKRVATILMADLRGFTAIGERLPAEVVVNMINIYLEAMTEIILKYQGTIDEFIGDAILVIFGAPIFRDDDAKRAVACSLEMQLAMEGVNKKNREAGYPNVAMGIGINTGDVVVGNIGSKKRTKYGVVGKNVNLTSRIESYTVGGQIFISESAKQACGNVLRIDDQQEVMPKGVKGSITIYEIGGISDDFNIFLPEKEVVKWYKLLRPLSVKFTILEEKHGRESAYDGKIIQLSKKGAEIQTSRACRNLTNLKLILFDEDGNEINNLYAKVTGCGSESDSSFIVTYTFVSPEAEVFINNNLSIKANG